MNKRDAKRYACAIAAAELSAFLGAGQPFTGHDCDPDACRECQRRVDAIGELIDELLRRSGHATLAVTAREAAERDRE